MSRAARRRPGRTALVLGAGGVLGAAWMTGALAALQARLPHPVEDTDLIVGTSVGSVIAAALRCAAVSGSPTWSRTRAAAAGATCARCSPRT